MDYKASLFCMLMGFASGLFAQPAENQSISEVSTTANSPLEIEEIIVSSPERQNELLKGSPITKDVKIAQPSLISASTLDSIIEVLIWLECYRHSDVEKENYICDPWLN